jgi:lysyl-tRNA synthetase class 2
MSDQPEIPQDENKLIAERRAKLAAIRGQGVAFPNDFRRDAYAGDLQKQHAAATTEQLDRDAIAVKVAGRMLAKRVMGKASFATIADPTGRIQLFLQATALGDAYDAFKGWDIGDVVAAEGMLFRTRTGELSVKATTLRLLVKSLRPLPDKWHGLADVDTRYRQRYVDLIVNEDSRKVFEARTRIVRALRNALDTRGFLEV